MFSLFALEPNCGLPRDFPFRADVALSSTFPSLCIGSSVWFDRALTGVTGADLAVFSFSLFSGDLFRLFPGVRDFPVFKILEILGEERSGRAVLLLSSFEGLFNRFFELDGLGVAIAAIQNHCHTLSYRQTVQMGVCRQVYYEQYSQETAKNTWANVSVTFHAIFFFFFFAPWLKTQHNVTF